MPPIRDVVLMPDMRDEAGDLKVFEEPTFTQHADLGFDLEITPIAPALAQAIRKACDPPGENHAPAVDLRPPILYGIARVNAPSEELYHWDPDGRLQECVALSRFVQPTSLAFEYAARIMGDPLGDTRVIVPGPVKGAGSHAWVADETRNWLTPECVPDLKEMLAAFYGHPPGKRAARAMWYHEYTARSYELDVRWTFAATALEALVNAGRANVTAQFVQRVCQINAALGLSALSAADAQLMYRHRSKLVHGEGLGSLGQRERGLYIRMEAVLRAVVQRCILDPAFDAVRYSGYDPAGLSRLAGWESGLEMDQLGVRSQQRRAGHGAKSAWLAYHGVQSPMVPPGTSSTCPKARDARQPNRPPNRYTRRVIRCPLHKEHQGCDRN